MGFKVNDSVHKGLSNIEEQQWLRTCYDHYWKLFTRRMTSWISKGEKKFQKSFEQEYFLHKNTPAILQVAVIFKIYVHWKRISTIHHCDERKLLKCLLYVPFFPGRLYSLLIKSHCTVSVYYI